MRLPANVRRAVRRHVERAVSRINPARYRQEPSYIAALFAKLDDVVFDGQGIRVELRSTIVADRGRGSAESIWGADFALTSSIRSKTESVEKASLGQGKKHGFANVRAERERLRTQVVQMSDATRASIVLEMPQSVGVIPNVSSVFPIAGIPHRDDLEADHGGPPYVLFPQDLGGQPVIIGQSWSLDEYIADGLIGCTHGDQRPQFVEAVRRSDLAALRIDVTEKPLEQRRRRISLNDEDV